MRGKNSRLGTDRSIPRQSTDGEVRNVAGSQLAQSSGKSTRASPSSTAIDALQGKLAQSEARFQGLLETAATPILLLSAQRTVRDMNAAAEILYGLNRGDVIGQDFFAALDADRQSGIHSDDLTSVLEGHPVQGVEGQIRHVSGMAKIVLWNMSRFFDERNDQYGIIVNAQDITERQKAEEALREREARLSSIIETAPDAVITIDEMGIIQSFSVAAEKLFGYEAGEVIGRNINILMPSPHHEDHDSYLHRYRTTGEKRIIGIGRQVEAKRKDGSVFPMELAVGEAKFGNTRIFTGFIRDITARTRIEEQLRQSQKMEAVGQLTGGLAHDFNNLLTVIGGNLEMLESRIDDAVQAELLTEAQEATRLGARLAGRLLAFGRRQPLNPKPIDLNALIISMNDLLRRSLGEAISVQTKLLPDLPATLADASQAENVLLNLAINGRDAMPRGGKLLIDTNLIRIQSEDHMVFPELPPGTYVVLTVTDNGVGMPPHIVQRVFEPFFTTKSPGQGTGLGLSMVYGFVKQSGGHIHLYSEEGTGTTVKIFLPAAKDATVGEEDSAAPMVSGRGEVILVVEDDDRVRRLTLRRLQDLGYRVIEENNATPALARIKNGEAVDLLFTDVVMPGVSGLDLAQAARSVRPELKVLFTSGYAEAALARGEALTDNADWLGKPYTTAELALKLRTLLDA